MQTSNWDEVYSKVIALVKNFPTVCGTPLPHKEIKVIFDFCGRKSNWQFNANLSFGHNLCFRYPNGSCDPILNIYVQRSFQWYKKIFNPISIDPWNCFIKIRKSIKIPTPKVGVHLGVWRFIPSHFPRLLRAWDVTPRLPFWLTPLQAFALVTNPSLRCNNIKPVWMNCYSRIFI